MNSRDLKEMEKILSLQFERRQQVFLKVVEQEGQLRATLARLKEQETAAGQTDQHNVKAIGADVVWNAWLERTRKSLNLELAQVLAQKERLLESVRKEYGKLLSSRELLKKQSSLEGRMEQKLMLERSIDAHLQSR